ncbi:V-type proton ATPase subunit E [Wickerhamomyces ciferrii]|uniref:V-type proton ATPase subunit E n=1 Tax=Wickerhamomyces ciferrii (strain ATCC 14091 / BCRC 22168 / CBS 111 / JCM 3599 / NBRC 0793 / NRRL Y-1031 F-60-10) TaxID=1206466 RepID=K0KQH4_WICCF|nr:V-type proton ATPase subunit E [Wickerhamomyces ciferrii]CCH45281.1 V-type proton ATPase subunit E [Wickerhamomyces ciferrii]
MSARALSDNQADEEYEIEKAAIVRNETKAIDELYKQKTKKADLAQQITKSTIANKTRLKVLSTREKVLDDIFQETEKQLKKISSNKEEYKPVLVGLIEEGVLSLLEKFVTVKVRKQDVEITKEAIKEAQEAFEKKAKFQVDIQIDEEDYLSDDLAGGVILTNSTGKIEINNTLEERLKLLSEESLPAIRLSVFGQSPSRKFFD